MNSNICFDDVYENAFRINKENFVSLRSFDFPQAAVDAADDNLAALCRGDYITINEVDMFLSFPEVGYAWNSFFLESYVCHFSKRFKLLHERFNATMTIGAIVKRGTTAFVDYYSVIVDALAHSGVELNQESAYDFLVSGGYLGTASYNKIVDAMRDAQNLRKSFHLS